MDDDFDVDDGPKENISETKRVSRNMNEKKRRDRFNVLISELAAVIPDSTAVGTSKIDKTTVLKKAVAYLRSHSNRSTVALSRPTANWQPAFVNDAELNQVLLEAMSGFLLVLDGSGIITFASDSIISILGYRPQDVVNNSVADYLDQTDKSCIFAHLALLEKLKSSTQESSNSTYSSVAVSDPVNFEMTLNSGPCFKSQVVECFSCIGQAFTTNAAPHSSSNFQVIVICYSSNSKPNLTQPLFDVTSKEFTSRLTLDWKFTCVDNRIMLVLGYQPSELVNKSIYAFIHHEDLVNIKTYHEMLVRKGRINTCYYRFLTKGEVWVWLRSCCHISYNQWNSKPEYVTVKSNPVHYEEVFSNQEVLVKNDRLHFQSITRDFRSESCIKIHSKRADSPLSFACSEKSKDQALTVRDPCAFYSFGLVENGALIEMASYEEPQKSRVLRPFDLYINRKTNRIEFDAHYKKTNTNVNFKKKSNHPPHIKRAVIKGFAERARHLCDDENKVEAELENVEEVFVANKYTQEEIKETIHQTKKDTQTKTKDTTENQRETYVVPCMRGLSYDFHIWLCMYGADVHIEGAYVHIEGADVPITWRRT
ncbi:circadian locomoter output cycles protein kaput [Exaiptasia diaphana]|uniref:Uncharacterized protein n=1 Tax=Exaiptasia diaphana TaxID=2652724 RepID=A0A913YEB3_EXADI|nr:circadian locomoter output cycles protein kaput [Exaiptasia diaphana]